MCVNTSASAHDRLEREGVLSVNVLRPSQLQVASVFTSSRIKGEDRFACGHWSERDGVPVLGDASVVFSWVQARAQSVEATEAPSRSRRTTGGGGIC